MAVIARQPKLLRLSSCCIFLRALKFAALSNGATSTANASQNDVVLGLINYVYLNVLFCFIFYSASVKTLLLHSAHPLLLPPTTLSLPLPLASQAVLNVVGGGCVCAC